MILQALHRLADAEGLVGDPDYLYKPVSWAVRLRDNGTLVGIEDLRRDLNAGTTRKAKWVGKREPVPYQPTRTSGAAAFFLVDKAEYALGVDPAGDRPADQLNERVGLFQRQVADCAAATDDPAARAVATFLDSSIQGDRPPLPDGVAANELFAFRVGEGGFVHLRPAVKAYWKSKRSPTTEGADGGGKTFRCLVTGRVVGEVGGFPLVKRLPGGTPSGVALVSHNAGAFESHGLKGGDNAPVGRAAAEAVAVALNRLLDPNPLDGRGEKLARRHLRLTSDTAVVYWSPDQAGDTQRLLDDLLGLSDDQPPEAVAEVYRSVSTGRVRAIDRPSDFYAITLTGTQGRAVVRDWMESSVEQIRRSTSAYFDDLRLLQADDRGELVEVRPPSLRDVKLAAWRKLDDVPAPFGRDWLRLMWASGRSRVPTSFAARVAGRVRTGLAKGDTVSPQAFAILKLHLKREGDNAMRAYLNEDHPSGAYHCGRLLSVLDYAQQKALPGANTTNVRRMLGAVMTAPALYLGRIRKMTQTAYLPKLDGDWAEFLSDRIGSISGRLGDGLPPMLKMAEQSTFFLGFDQERTYLQTHPATRYKRRTSAGLWVLSRGEQDVAESLARLGHDFAYEPGLRLFGEAWRVPDFLVLDRSASDADRVFIEYLGMMRVPEYKDRWRQKLEEYRAFGLLPIEEGGGPKGKLIVLDADRHRDRTTIMTELQRHLAPAEGAIDDPADSPEGDPE